MQAMDHEAVEGDMDQEAVEGAVDRASDGRSDRWYKRWITKQSKEIWIRKLSKERWMVQAMEGAVDGAYSTTLPIAPARHTDLVISNCWIFVHAAMASLIGFML